MSVYKLARICMSVSLLQLQQELRNTQKERIGERSLRHCALYNFQNTEDDYPLYAAIISYLFEKIERKNRLEILVALI